MYFIDLSQAFNCVWLKDILTIPMEKKCVKITNQSNITLIPGYNNKHKREMS